MKAVLIILFCALLSSAAAVVLLDRFLEPHGRTSGGAGKPAPAATDPALLARLERIEHGLADIREMLQIPPYEPPTDSQPADPDAESRPLPVGIGQRLQYVEAAMIDLSRQNNADIMQVYSKLTKRLAELAAGLPSAASRPGAGGGLVDELRKQGVIYHPDSKSIEVDAMFTHPTRTLEFVGVAPGGNAYEGMLVLNALPSALKRAIADMGVKEAEDPDARTQLPPRGDGVYVYVTWEGRAKPIRIEDLIVTASGQTKLPRTKFVFTASREFIDRLTWEDHFAADVYKNVIALTWNYAADCVLACPLAEAQYEDRWIPDTQVIPAPETKATVYLLREPRAEWDQK